MKRKQICLYIYIFIYLYTYIPMTYMYLTCLLCYTILILNKLIEMLTEIIFFFFWKGVQNIIRFKSFNCQLFSLVQGLVNTCVTCDSVHLFTNTREKELHDWRGKWTKMRDKLEKKVYIYITGKHLHTYLYTFIFISIHRLKVTNENTYICVKSVIKNL